MTFGYLDVVRRASPTPPPLAALGARSALRARFRPGEFEDRAVRPWIKLIWSLQGQGAVRLSGRVHHLPAGQVAVFFPGMCHEAWAAKDSPQGWEARWVTMDGSLCAEFARAVGLRRAGVYTPDGDLTAIFARYRAGLAAATPRGAQEADLAAHELLACLGGQAQTARAPTDPLAVEALSLLQSRWPEPTFGVAQAAELTGVHRSVFSRRFRAAVGVSPQQHLMDLRMGHALNLLRSTDLAVREVAFRCGFADASYFTRLFHRVQGVTPKHHRTDESPLD